LGPDILSGTVLWITLNFCPSRISDWLFPPFVFCLLQGWIRVG
jgi:hypothetical protein